MTGAAAALPLPDIATSAAVLGAAGADADLAFARHLQGLSLGLHIIIVCFGVAFPMLVLAMEGMWLRTGDPVYRAIAKRWSKAMVVLFAVGVVSGTIISFELGILWPEFMARFGEVFGLGFALEGFSFFVEAIFIAVYAYGWDRLPRRWHFASGVPIVIAGITGSLFVISVNAWMNNPVGFRLVDGRVTDVDPWAALFNPSLPHEMLHMYLAAYMVAGFGVAGVYAWGWMRGRRERQHRIALVVPLVVAALVAPVQVLVGDLAARRIAQEQPLKLAAIEGLGRTQAHAPLHLGGWYRDGEVVGGIRVPSGLSLLAEHDPAAAVSGLDAAPPADRPPVNVVRASFQTMVAIGTGLAALSAVVLVTWWRRRRLPRFRGFLTLVVAAGPLAALAMEAGWVTTEVGRQPWIVYGVMRTEDAVTAAEGLPAAYGVVALVYVALAAGAIYALRRLARRPWDLKEAAAGTNEPIGSLP
jgi:cytochrome d ubiquinol oxidase subunit I